MKKSLLIGLVVGLIAVPTLGMAAGPEGHILLASNRLSDQELGVTSGQGLASQQLVQNQQPQGRIVIWDDWAHRAQVGTEVNAASPGQVSINHATRQATVTAAR
jgi:hypothetical protein